MKNLLFTCLILLVISFGCSDEKDPVTPVINTQPIPGAPVKIGADGGQVISEDGIVTLNIPKNALSETLTISIKKVNETLPNTVKDRSIGNTYELLPSGTDFQLPINVKLDLSKSSSGLNKDNVLVCHWENSNQFEYIIADQVSNNKLFFKLLSFSFIKVLDVEDKQTSIPDKNFEQALIDAGRDADGIINGKVVTKYIRGAQDLFLQNKNIKDLTGIEDFIGLKRLYLFSNELTELNLHTNTQLEIVRCDSNKIATIDIRSKKLQTLGCNVNSIIELNLSDMKELDFLDCRNNQISSLNLSDNPNLRSLAFDNNKITSIDLSNNSNLEVLSCDNSNLTELDVSNNLLLETVYCINNNLTSLDFSSNNNLKFLYCSRNNLSTLNIDNATSLEFLRCGNNKLTEIDIDDKTNLTDLQVGHNELTKLDVSNNRKLIGLSTIYNQIKILDVSNHPSLEYLWCYNNKIEILNVSQSAKLRSVYCGDNQIKELDLSNQTQLEVLGANKNELVKLNLRNGYNETFKSISTNGNSELDCVQVDDVSYSSSNWVGNDAFFFNPEASFSEDCGY